MPPSPETGATGDAELYALLAEAVPWGFAICSRDGRLLATNGQLAALWGLAREETARIAALGRTAAAHEALVAALAARAVDPNACASSGGAPAEGEIVLRDGRVLERHVVFLAGAIVASFRDVSARSWFARELRDAARQQAALASLGELAMNAEHVAPLLQAACASAVEVLDVDLAAHLDLEGGIATVRAAASRPGAARPLAAGARIAGAAGGLRPVLPALGLAACAEVTLPGHRSLGVLGVYHRDARQFTADELRFLETAASIVAAALARRHAEEELLERERQARAVFEGGRDALVMLDDAGTIRDANASACTLLRAPRLAIVGRALTALSPALAQAVAPGPGGAAAGAEAAEVVMPGERPRTVEVTAVPDILPGRHLAVVRDVTERKQLQARLALADRMSSVGTLAAGVAHELNNPLAYVTANLTFVAERLGRLAEPPATGPEPELAAQLAEAIGDALDGAERMRIIVRDLRTFSRAGEERTGPVALGPVIDSCVSMAWNEIRHRARLVRDVVGAPAVLGSEARLGQVFLNLLVNAAHAIPEGRVEENEIRLSARDAGGGRVAVEVRDTGCGIRPEHLPRIFDPFFTTKAPGVGTGLGLAICHGIVTGLGGEISAESGPGGTTVRVVLPAAAPPPEQATPAPAAAAAARGRILVVDDEPLVGTVLRRGLQRDHDVTVTTSGRAALDLLARGERFDVILSDLLMPEMSGMDLHHAVAERDAALAGRMIFLTGGAFTPAAREFVAREAVVCVEKPFDLGALRAVLARALEAPA